MTEIRTTNGIVRGRREDTLSVFRGIPYAQAPVGERRFAAPLPGEPWDGVRDVLEFGPPAPQANSPHHIGNCLTLNVWTPENLRRNWGILRIPEIPGGHRTIRKGTPPASTTPSRPPGPTPR